MQLSKRSPLLFIALLAGLLLLSACNVSVNGASGSSLSAGQVLQNSLNAMKQLKTSHVNANLSLQASDVASTSTTTNSTSSQLPSNINATVKASGDEQLPDQAQTNVTLSAASTSTQVAEVMTTDKVYVQVQDKWYVIDKSTFENSGYSSLFSGVNINQNDLIGIVQNAKITDHGDQTLNGQSLRHITATLDKNSLQQLLAENPQLANQLGQQNITNALNDLTLHQASIDLWIDETQFYVHRTELKLNLTANTSSVGDGSISSVSANLDSIVDLSNFNQPVTITPPASATPITNLKDIFNVTQQQ